MGALIAALGGVFALRKLDDFDTWWHLAAGRWIAGHGIPSTDPLSETVRSHAWVNLQWGFDVGIYQLHALGGPALLCLAAAAGFSFAVWLTWRSVARSLGPIASALFMALVIVAAQERFAVRPEMLSFPLLAGILAILERTTPDDGRVRWLLVPLMLVWVNVHALFVIGAFAVGCAAVDDFVRKRGLSPFPVLVSLGVVFVNPFGIRGVLFPLKLLSRIDRSNDVFQTIGEFRSPFAADAGGAAVAAYKAVLIVGLAAAVAGLVVRLRAKASPFEWGGLLFFVGLAALSITARRNGALFAIGVAPFIARCARAAANAAWGPRADVEPRRRTLLTAGIAVSILLLAATVVTGAFYRWDRQPREFGFGVVEESFPIRASGFARAATLPGRLYNDVATGGYLAWDDPLRTGVFIDGRLEVYDTAFFTDYVRAMYDQTLWQEEADRYGIQTAIVFHRWENRRRLVERLVQDRRWSLVYADEVAAIFVRVEGNDAALARASALNESWNRKTREWLTRPLTRWPYPAGRVEGTRAFARLLATVGDADGATEAYLKLLELGVARDEEVEVRLILARRFAQTGRDDLARDQARRVLALDPGNTEALKVGP